MMTTDVKAASKRRFGAARAAFLLGLAALFAAPTLQAQTRKELGRMWTFEAAPLGWFQEAYDWQPSEQWLEHARLASLRFGREQNGSVRYFCSASFVSPYGLIMTNHHCSRDAIAAVQGDNDWLKDGFYAGSYDGEIKLPGFLMSQMVGQKDVTKEVNEQGQEAVLAAAKEAQPELSHQVIALYQGGNYQLYSFKIYDDLRLVCAPHGQIAHFGGDADNFCYPRWGLDFSFVRAYENGKPVDSKEQCFEWRTEGARQGEPVFVTGNPGSTGRLKTLAQCEFLRDYAYPPAVERTVKALAELNERAAQSPEAEKELRPQILSLENRRKAFQGYLDGLRNPRVLAIKSAAEAELRAAVARKPELQEQYGDAWDKLAAIQVKKINAVKAGENPAKFTAEEKEQEKRIGEACFAVYGTSIPPDATMSLRLSDGVVKGYEMNGTLAPFFTTLYGLYARYNEFSGVHPFDLPQVWIDREQQLDLKTPFNFVATCDIIGGNSGSPMIDRDLKVIGLVFDGNIEMLGNNYVFDDEISRTVSVHPAIIIEALRKIYDAGKLADELERKGDGKMKVGLFERVRRDALEAKLTKTKADVTVIANAVLAYLVRTGGFPDDLAVLAQKDDSGRFYLEEVPADIWGNAFRLRLGNTPRQFEVVSCGPDGKLGTADDISSWAR